MKKLVFKHFIFINRLLSKRYLLLLISLVGMLVLPSLFEPLKYSYILSYVLQGIVLFACVYAVSESRMAMLIETGAGIILVSINWMGLFNNNATVNFYFSFFVFVLFYIYVMIRLIRKISNTPVVNQGVMFAAINVYLLIGIVGGFLFMMIENAIPGSIKNLEIESLTDPSRYIYFSFITLSTLGYGDIVPVGSVARSLAIILSTTGPLYLTVLVAMLVGRYLLGSNKSKINQKN